MTLRARVINPNNSNSHLGPATTYPVVVEIPYHTTIILFEPSPQTRPRDKAGYTWYAVSLAPVDGKTWGGWCRGDQIELLPG